MDDCRRITKYQLVKEEFIATTPKYSEDEYIEINLNFSFSVESFLWGVRDDEEAPRLLLVVATDPGKEYRVRLSSNQLSNFEEETRQLVVEELKEMAMSHGRRKKMVDYALKAASQIINEDRNSYGVLNLQFKVVLECHYLLHLDEILGPSSRMVPAADSSIEGLKTVAVDSRRDICCSICLEEFSEGCGQGLAMPCSHVFHGDCIKTWLRTSHYCPLCRFEMPTI